MISSKMPPKRNQSMPEKTWPTPHQPSLKFMAKSRVLEKPPLPSKQASMPKEVGMNFHKGQAPLPMVKSQYTSVTPHAAVGAHRRGTKRYPKGNGKVESRFQHESDMLVCFMKKERELFQAKNVSCRRYPWGGFVSQEKDPDGSGRSSNRSDDVPVVRPMCDFAEWENAQKEKMKTFTSSQRSRDK
mmetsp:Transcript_50733/g.158500  ORF Transcript_50733/g.158500 Transcript_50733/m.158500 type:complete len:186 (-) Transcript_50733:1803-2360(-)